ncbi:hypothetical protein CV102_22935 [Natronococcus pandeyae]|uniref:Uncharacterized protein n=1 Tax=Natronococcus pandeyae TaxID=2055836 RepID=A0A8J8Q0T3_9EURY|nr:hypothetical protein [Natronococcus pandeyae]TYL36318.1 hypothetical protein CV102_22935 [Natronococcus pandeyae]
MKPDDSGDTGISVRTEWFRFGIYLAFLYAAFTLVIVYLLRVDRLLGLLVAVVGSVTLGLAITVYVLYIR